MTAPFECPVAGHKHDGTTTCYQTHGCRCVPCRAKASTHNIQFKKLKAYGRYVSPYVPAEPVRAWVRHLMESGLGEGHIANLAGIHSTTISTLLWGRNSSRQRRGVTGSKTILAVTADRIMAVQPSMEGLSPTALVSSTPTVRRLQALMAVGWSQRRVGDRLGVTKQNIARFLVNESVTVRTHQLVAALYEELWNATPPASTPAERGSTSRAKSHAARRRWLPPLAWDDIDTDVEPPLVDVDPDYVDEVLIELAMTGEAVRLTRAERLEALTRLNARHITDGIIAELLHVDVRTVLRNRRELNLPAAVGYDQQPLIAA